MSICVGLGVAVVDGCTVNFEVFVAVCVRDWSFVGVVTGLHRTVASRFGYVWFCSLLLTVVVLFRARS